MTTDLAPDRPLAPVRYLPLELRALFEVPRFLAMLRALPAGFRRGDGHPVLVIPGYGLDDRPTWALREALGRLGYAAHGWGLGRNMGVQGGLFAALSGRIEALAESGGPVSLIGWSLGGVIAREQARAVPAHVRRVVTLGSPFAGEPDANIFDHARRVLGRERAIDRAAFDARRPPPPVPTLAIHTKTDGVVAWRCSLEEPAPHTENLEVRGSHGGLVYNIEVLRVLAERLPT